MKKIYLLLCFLICISISHAATYTRYLNEMYLGPGMSVSCSSDAGGCTYPSNMNTTVDYQGRQFSYGRVSSGDYCFGYCGYEGGYSNSFAFYSSDVSDNYAAVKFNVGNIRHDPATLHFSINSVGYIEFNDYWDSFLNITNTNGDSVKVYIKGTTGGKNDSLTCHGAFVDPLIPCGGPTPCNPSWNDPMQFTFNELRTYCPSFAPGFENYEISSVDLIVDAHDNAGTVIYKNLQLFDVCAPQWECTWSDPVNQCGVGVNCHDTTLCEPDLGTVTKYCDSGSQPDISHMWTDKLGGPAHQGYKELINNYNFTSMESYIIPITNLSSSLSGVRSDVLIGEIDSSSPGYEVFVVAKDGSTTTGYVIDRTGNIIHSQIMPSAIVGQPVLFDINKDGLLEVVYNGANYLRAFSFHSNFYGPLANYVDVSPYFAGPFSSVGGSGITCNQDYCAAGHYSANIYYLPEDILTSVTMPNGNYFMRGDSHSPLLYDCDGGGQIDFYMSVPKDNDGTVYTEYQINKMSLTTNGTPSLSYGVNIGGGGGFSTAQMRPLSCLNYEGNNVVAWGLSTDHDEIFDGGFPPDCTCHWAVSMRSDPSTGATTYIYNSRGGSSWPSCGYVAPLLANPWEGYLQTYAGTCGVGTVTEGGSGVLAQLTFRTDVIPDYVFIDSNNDNLGESIGNSGVWNYPGGSLSLASGPVSGIGYAEDIINNNLYLAFYDESNNLYLFTDFVDPVPPVYQCGDGIDNDGDLLIDYPTDPGCASITDNSEVNGGGGGGGGSCGDHQCTAPYEDQINCPADCGAPPEETIVPPEEPPLFNFFKFENLQILEILREIAALVRERVGAALANPTAVIILIGLGVAAVTIGTPKKGKGKKKQ